MRLDLAERLRCPQAHAPTPLIVVAGRVDERDLLQGVAGCPVCHAEVPIEEGDAWFGVAPDAAAPLRTTGGGARAGAGPSVGPPLADALERLVALLGLAEPGGAVLLTGSYGRLALHLAANAEYSVVTLGADGSAPEPGEGYRRGLPVASVRGRPPTVPFSDATFRAAALGAGLEPALAADAVRAVAVGGRVVGARALPLPDAVKELARDDAEWVGERVAQSPIITLGRRGG